MSVVWGGRFVIAAFYIILLSTPCARASSVIKGTVVDGETHAPVAFATVRVVQLNRALATEPDGTFSFTAVPAGDYTVEVTSIGYRKAVTNTRIRGEGLTTTLYIHLFSVPIQTSAIVVTGEHPNSRIDEIHEASQLRGKDLQRDLGQTIAATLKNETGLAIRSMGPAPARPVIRGLGGDRIVISEDGMKTGDLSATSPDHAVTVEPFTVDRIEVVRGPRVLLRGSTTIGGVVNIVRDEIPAVMQERVSGNIGLFGESANSGYLGSAVGIIPVSPFVLRGEISRRRASDLRTPTGRLANSEVTTLNYSGGLSFLQPWGHAGVSFREYESDYGIPGGFVGAHPRGVDISLFKRQINARGRWNLNGGSIESVDLESGRTFYRHTELESSGLVGAEFAITTYTARLQMNHRYLGPSETGSVGVSFETRDFTVGGFVFTPPTTSFSVSGFAFESFAAGDWDFQASLRLNHDRLKPQRDNPEARIGHIRLRSFITYSLSFSALYEFTPQLFGGGNISRSSRVPTIEELYSEGPHLAAYSYEVGNPDLRDEHGVGTELFAYYRTPSVFVMVTGFMNNLPYYIISQNTGRTNFTTLLPTYATAGVSARISGIESQVSWNFAQSVSISTSLSYTHGVIKGISRPLPAIPPLKGLIEIKYSTAEFTAGLASEVAAAQKRVDEFEEQTAGYVTFNGFAQYVLPTGGLIHNVSLTADNIFNKEYRNHLSRVKVILPEAGRNFRLIYRVFF